MAADADAAAAAGRARELYAASQYEEAALAYGVAIDALADDADAHTLATLYANRAAARLRLGGASDAAHDAALALSLCPASWRPRMRLAEALLQCGGPRNAASASCELRHLLSLPSLPPHVQRDAAALLRQAGTDGGAAFTAAGPVGAFDDTSALEAAASSTTAAGSRLTSGAQMLRVHVSAPSALRLGSWHTISVRLSNEMGLFDGRVFDTTGRDRVRLGAIVLHPMPGCSEDASNEIQLSLRQAAEPVPPPDAAGVTSVAALSPAPARASWLQLHGGRGRAVADLRLSLPSLPEANSPNPPQQVLVVLRAELVQSDSSASADDADNAMVLGALSLPISVEIPPAAAWHGRECDTLPPTDERAESRLPDVTVQSALTPLLRSFGTDDLTELVAGFRLLRPPRGSTCDAPLVLAESASGICGRVWDSGVTVATWLADELPPVSAELGILELGSGVGVAGLAAAAVGWRVLLTDLPDALPLMRVNVAANAHRFTHVPTVAALEWGCDEASLRSVLRDGDDASSRPSLNGSMLVLCSDVVYEPTAYEPLVCTLRQLAEAGVATRTLMAHRSRHPDEHLFFESASREFRLRLLRGPPFVPLGAREGTSPLRYGLAGSDEDEAQVQLQDLRVNEAMPNVTDSSSVVRLIELTWRGGEPLG